MKTVEALAFEVIMSLVSGALGSLKSYVELPFLQNLKIKRRIEIATAEVVEPLVPFLANEGICTSQQELLFRTCKDELQPLLDHPEALFEGSLDGQKIFDNLYLDKGLPQAIRDEKLEGLYSLLFPRVATLLCRIPATVKEWEVHAWSENFRRLDEIAVEMRLLFLKLDSVEDNLIDDVGGILAVARKTLAQRVSMQLDLTGLRADRPIAGTMEDFFVHPELSTTGPDRKRRMVISSREESLPGFTRRSTQAVVYSDPGFGKSTWTRWLQKELLTSSWLGLAIRVELRHLPVDSLPSLHELIRQQVTVHVVEDLTNKRIGEWVKKGQLVFILDGFDEIGPKDRDSVRQWIIDLQEAITPCPIVVTSRPLTTTHLSSLPTKWKMWRIEPFDNQRILDYIRRWYAKVPLLIDAGTSHSPEGVSRQLSGDPTIAPLTSNPLLLSTLLMVHHLDGSLPSGRAQLYGRYVDGMLGLWDDRRKIHSSGLSLNLGEKKRILTVFALHLQMTQREQVDEDEAFSVIRGCLAAMQYRYGADQVLALLRERTGLLVGPGTYSFIHKSVYEFLVAEAAVQGTHTDANGRRIDRLHLFECRQDDRWNVVIFLWAGLAPVADVESFIDLCLSQRDLSLGYGIFKDQYERFSPEYRRHLVLRLLKSKPPLRGDRHFWGISGALGGDERILAIPDMPLRGLGHPSLANVLFRAAEDGTLRWSDVSDARGALRELTWMSVVLFSSEADEWVLCVKKVPARYHGQAQWMLWLADIIVTRCLKDEAEGKWQGYIRLFSKLYPDFSDLLNLALLDNYAFFNKELRVEDYDRILSLIGELSWDRISPERLLLTHKWARVLSREEEAVDLLDAAIKRIVTWKDQMVGDQTGLSNAVYLLEQQRSRRQIILQNSVAERASPKPGRRVSGKS